MANNLVRWNPWGRRAAAIGTLSAGLAMMILPGPGLFTVLAGLVLLEQDVPAIARLNDRLRRWIAGAEAPSQSAEPSER